MRGTTFCRGGAALIKPLQKTCKQDLSGREIVFKHSDNCALLLGCSPPEVESASKVQIWWVDTPQELAKARPLGCRLTRARQPRLLRLLHSNISENRPKKKKTAYTQKRIVRAAFKVARNDFSPLKYTKKFSFAPRSLTRRRRKRRTPQKSNRIVTQEQKKKFRIRRNFQTSEYLYFLYMFMYSHSYEIGVFYTEFSRNFSIPSSNSIFEVHTAALKLVLLEIS